MAYHMKWLNKKNLRKWLRIIHRDLGYFVVGITIVYGISGIILNHKEPRVDPAFKTIAIESQIQTGLTIQNFQSVFNEDFEQYTLNKIIPQNTEYQLFLKGGIGSYNIETGMISFEIYQKKPFLYFINKLHYNQKNFWTTPADFYAGGLIFLAISGLFMVRGKNGISRRGKWYVISGFILVLVYIWI